MNDLAWRRLKATLPPWIRHHDAIETEESRSWVPPPSGAGVANLKAVHLAEVKRIVKRIKENKGYMLHFPEETEAEARTTERNKTFQQEVLEEIHQGEELEGPQKRNGFRLKEA